MSKNLHIYRSSAGSGKTYSLVRNYIRMALVGNGVNRDTGVYVGVQTLENSGVDRRVDLILTEAGMEWCCPETHAIWS